MEFHITTVSIERKCIHLIFSSPCFELHFKLNFHKTPSSMDSITIKQEDIFELAPENHCVRKKSGIFLSSYSKAPLFLFFQNSLLSIFFSSCSKHGQNYSSIKNNLCISRCGQKILHWSVEKLLLKWRCKLLICNIETMIRH